MPYPAYNQRRDNHRDAIQQMIEDERYAEWMADCTAGFGYDANADNPLYDEPADLEPDEREFYH